MCINDLYKFINIYIKYPVLTELDTQSKLKSEFPAITVCNLNRAKYSFAGDAHIVRTLSGGGSLVLTERKIILNLAASDVPSANATTSEVT